VGGGVKLQLTALQKMTEFGLVWTATLDGPESVGQKGPYSNRSP
jgi:hypothetical protein